LGRGGGGGVSHLPGRKNQRVPSGIRRKRYCQPCTDGTFDVTCGGKKKIGIGGKKNPHDGGGVKQPSAKPEGSGDGLNRLKPGKEGGSHRTNSPSTPASIG